MPLCARHTSRYWGENRPGVDMIFGGRWVKGGERGQQDPKVLLQVVQGRRGQPQLGKCLGMKWDRQIRKML